MSVSNPSALQGSWSRFCPLSVCSPVQRTCLCWHSLVSDCRACSGEGFLRRHSLVINPKDECEFVTEQRPKRSVRLNIWRQMWNLPPSRTGNLTLQFHNHTICHSFLTHLSLFGAIRIIQLFISRWNNPVCLTARLFTCWHYHEVEKAGIDKNVPRLTSQGQNK